MQEVSNPTFIDIECKCPGEKKEWPAIIHDGLSVKLTLCGNCEKKPNFEPLIGVSKN